MSINSKALAEARHVHNRERKAAVQPLLVPRNDARVMLGNPSVAHMLQLEASGVLTPVRLNPKSSVAKVYYRYEQILALVNGAATIGPDQKEYKRERAERKRRRKPQRESRAKSRSEARA